MTKLLLFLIISGLLASQVNSQCVYNCSCIAFSSVCCLTIEENRPPNTVVGVPNFELGSTSFVWSQTNSNNGIFQINETTGIISTLISIDREENYIRNGVPIMDDNHCFSLGFDVHNGGSNFVNIQIVDVSDNAPLFSEPSYSISIKESNDANDTVPDMCDRLDIALLTAMDKDEGRNAETIYRVEGTSLFELADIRIPCVQTKPGVGLDRDIPPSSYSFTLIAQDVINSSLTSTANVTYFLRDINDNRPFFDNSTVTLSIKENLEPGTFIYQFVAHDMDSGTNGEAGIVYRLESRENKFMIDDSNGTLTLAEGLDVAADDVITYTLMVSATDMKGISQNMENPLTGTVDVTINVEDVNEKATTTFMPATFSIMEGDQYIDQFITFLIVDERDITAENKVNTLTSDQDIVYLDHFMLGSSFRFRLFLNGSVNYEDNEVINVVLNLTEGGDPVFHTILNYTITILDRNDNPPCLNITQFTISEEEETIIVNLDNYTYDLDNGTNGTVAKYELVSVFSQKNENLTSVFTNQLAETGLLSANKDTIDRERVGDFLTFVVNITDAGSPPQSKRNAFTVTVTDKNDNSPRFNDSSYAFDIYEGVKVGSRVGQVWATDPDNGENGTVRYAIDPPSQYFFINETTGEIRSKEEFDRESNINSYLINVRATDRGSIPTPPQSVMVMILIGDVNDNNPIFDKNMVTFEIGTNLSPGSEIGKVVATDEDTSIHNNLTWYQLQKGPSSSMFSIRNNVSGVITLETALSEEGTYTLNISAFNPGKEESGDSILVTILVSRASFLSVTAVSIIGGSSSAGLLILIIITGILVICFCLKNRKSKRLYKMNEVQMKLTQSSILKIPAVNGTAGRSGRVTFKERVEETHYDEESVINSTKNTIKMESVTKFDNSPRDPHSFTSGDCSSPSPSSSPSSSGQPGHPGDFTVVDLETSPRHGMNGDINGHCQYDVHSHPHSPIIRIANASSRGHGEMMEYSQGTSSDGHTSNNDLDDEESMYSDDASIVNTALSRFGNNRPDLGMPYETPSTHSHMELHRHLPPMSHGQHTHSSSLAQLHAHNLAQLAKANSSEARPQYSSLLSPEHELTLTHTHDPLQHTSISSQSSTHSPSGAINHMGVSSNSKHHHLGGGRNYPHPLVMPDAYPRDPPDVHRFPIGSYADYGEASTYASTELDEALGFNLEAEPGIISLTATDYEDTEL